MIEARTGTPRDIFLRDVLNVFQKRMSAERRLQGSGPSGIAYISVVGATRTSGLSVSCAGSKGRVRNKRHE